MWISGFPHVLGIKSSLVVFDHSRARPAQPEMGDQCHESGFGTSLVLRLWIPSSVIPVLPCVLLVNQNDFLGDVM